MTVYGFNGFSSSGFNPDGCQVLVWNQSYEGDYEYDYGSYGYGYGYEPGKITYRWTRTGILRHGAAVKPYPDTSGSTP